jgi:DAPG hydrolase PhiG domain
MPKQKYLGYRSEDMALPHARFLTEKVKPIPKHIHEVLQKGALDAKALPPLNAVADLQKPGYTTYENGYALQADGSARVAVLTLMPGVVPLMWHWWFAWHGSHDDRYKLWHPEAHLSAAWRDGDQTREGYIGRISMIQEYIGDKLEKANIRFLEPGELGLPEASEREVFICARVGYTHVPLDFGWLVHQLRATADGAEMRSRFWMGGPHIQWRGEGAWAKGISAFLQKIKRIPARQAADLCRHCAEEMQHLAGFLPALYDEFAKTKP